MDKQHPWEKHRFLQQLRQALTAGHNQCFLHGRNVEQEWFYNGPLLGIQDMRETLVYNLLYAEDSLTAQVLVLAKTGMTLYVRPPDDAPDPWPQRHYPGNANELENLLKDENEDAGPQGVLGGQARKSSRKTHQAPVSLDDAAIPELFHRITRLMEELEEPLAVIVDGFQWLAELFVGRQHRLELIEEVHRWATAALGGRKLSMILLPDLEPLKTYLPLREEDIQVIQVPGPSVQEIADALTSFLRRSGDRLVGPDGFTMDDCSLLASAYKNKGYTLLNALHHFDRFARRAAGLPVDDWLSAFRRDLAVDLDDVRWEDVQLPDSTRAAIEALMQRFLEGADDAPGGVLLHGPPGTGKTHIARALANRGGYCFLPLKLADLKGRYVGESGKNVQALFAEARASAPTLMFIDEIDAVLGRRGGHEQDSFSNDIVNQFLAETDGVQSSRQNIFIVATTNRLDLVDPAVKSRLPALEIALPDASARRAMIAAGLPAGLNERQAAVERLVQRTDGLSGRDIRKTLIDRIRQAQLRGAEDPVQAGLAAMRRLVADQLDAGAAHVRLARNNQPGLERLIGLDKEKRCLNALATELLKPPPRLNALGIQPRNGILLHGPPGNGKTALIEALADEHALDLMLISGSQLRASGGLDPVRGLDRLIHDAQRIGVTGEGLLLFFDEFDALAQAPMEPQFRSALLGGIDRLRRHRRILIAAATNKPDRLEPAVVRSGRFDLHLPMSPPSVQDICRLLHNGIGQGVFVADYSDDELLQLAEDWEEQGVSVSDVMARIENARRLAVLSHAEAERIPVTMADLSDAGGVSG